MSRKKQLTALSLLLCCAIANGCGSDSDSDKEQKSGDSVFFNATVHSAPDASIKMNSVTSCMLDSDCVDTAFCFHGTCVSQCTNDGDCNGGVCSSRGRCLKSGSKARSAETDAIESDLQEAANAKLVELVPGIDVLEAIPTSKTVKLGSSSVDVTLVTTKDFGSINYVVKSINHNSVSDLLTAKSSVDPVSGITTYTFTVPTVESSLGEKGSTETLVIDTSAGNFELLLAPQKAVSGIYEGTVAGDRFNSAALPIRLAVNVTPKNATSFEEIEGIELMLPSSLNELFSPESVDASMGTSTKWSKVKMTKEDKAQNCLSGVACWVGKYSTDDFEFAGSNIIKKDQKINRNIRIEFAGYDAKTRSFDGKIRDIIGGFYREVDDSGNLIWSKPSMNGDLVVQYSDSLSMDESSIVDHNCSNGDNYRDTKGTIAPVCAKDSVADLMKLSTKDECKTISTADDALANVACLLDASKQLLDDDTLSSKIITGLLSTENTQTNPVQGFTSVQKFLEDCAKSDGICKERPEISCAVELLSSAYAAATVKDKEELIGVWHQMMRESYLGKQFSAWQNDIEVRKSWLENADSPSFLSSVLEALNTDMLASWETNVLDAHTSVLTRQFSQASLELLMSSGMSDEVKAERDVILSEFAQGWEGVSDSISLALRRYNTLLEKTTDRTTKAKAIRPRLFDLYFSGIIESDINYKTANTSLNATYGKNLFSNALLLQKLDRSFDDLVYLRDAEVAVSTSLDTNANNNVLAERKKSAEDTVKAATERRDKVFDDYNSSKINQASITSTLKNNLDSLKTEIVDLCGLPKGCTDKSKCEPLVDAGFCGYNINSDAKKPGKISRNVSDTESLQKYYDTSWKGDDKDWDGFDLLSEVNSGQAAEAILAYRAAQEDVDIARAEFIALSQKVAAAKEVCDTYEENLGKWNESRLDLIAQVQETVEKINEHMDNVYVAQQNIIKANLESQKAAYQKQADAVKSWQTTAEAYKTAQGKRISQIQDLRISASTIEAAGEIVKETTAAAATYFEEANGVLTGEDKVNAIVRGTVITGGTVIWAATKATAQGLEIAASETEEAKDKAELENDFELTKLEKETDLGIAELEKNLAEALGALGTLGDCTPPEKPTPENNCRRIVSCDCTGVDTSEIASEINCEQIGCKLVVQGQTMGYDQWVLYEENAAEALDQINDYKRELFEVNDLYERDLQDLEFKRLEYKQMAFDLLTKKQQVQKALVAQYNAQLHYYTIVQRAGMLQSQYNAASQRLAEITNLYETPAAIFSYASDLEVVENKIELAKERIYDYIAAVEYYAVRPFVDLRRATYLARSTNDLDKIVTELESITSKCGGQTTLASVEVSARELMGITRDMGTMTMADRFRYITRKGNIPVNSLTRYTVDSSVRDLVNKKGSKLRSGTFEVTLDENMNLATTCNAKISSIAIKLVGDESKLIVEGSGSKVIPTMTLFYDGQSQLASCQSNIESIVSNLGPKTKFGKYSTFFVTPTKISPTAGLNKFGEENQSLKGLPLATSYTLLIDPTISENSKINWDAVEDIEFQINYTYQDLFPTSSKCLEY